MITNQLSPDLFEYQPGNATRYMILATPIESEGTHLAGNGIAFMWLSNGDRGGGGMLLDTDEILDLAYFQEKTGIRNEADAVALLCFLGEQFGMRVGGMPMAYRAEGWFKKAEARGAA